MSGKITRNLILTAFFFFFSCRTKLYKFKCAGLFMSLHLHKTFFAALHVCYRCVFHDHLMRDYYGS